MVYNTDNRIAIAINYLTNRVSNTKIDDLTPVLYKNIIVTSMRTLFGVVGTALEVDLLALDADNEAILRVQKS